MTILDPERTDILDKACDHLAGVCPVMARALCASGTVEPIRRRPNSYAGLARTISFQQISTHAGLAIWNRLEERLAPITARVIYETPTENVLACGFSHQKATYLKNLAVACIEDGLDFDRLADSADSAVRDELLAIKGIGPWTVDIYMMFSLGRPDVFACTDLALLESYRQCAGLETRPTPGEMVEISDIWRPWRSVAAHVLWSVYSRSPAERLAW